jgi:hypothetical protein
MELAEIFVKVVCDEFANFGKEQRREGDPRLQEIAMLKWLNSSNGKPRRKDGRPRRDAISSGRCSAQRRLAKFSCSSPPR